MFRTPRTFIFLFLAALLLAACMPPATTPTTRPNTPQAETPSPPPAQPTEAGRFAQVVETRASVWLERPDESKQIPLAPGDQLSLLGTVATGETAQARLDILPEGTIVRIGPLSRLQLEALAPTEPDSRLRLWFGKIWIMLNGGRLEVETEIGVAAVRGSMLGVSFDPQNKMLHVTCLEGHCSLRNDAGETRLTAGQAASISAPGQPPSPPEPIPPEALQEWQAQMPEAAPFIPPTFLPPTAEEEHNYHPQPVGTPESTTLTPTSYTLINGCPETWHWVFTGPTTIVVDVPPNSTVSGQLVPIGTYTAEDWLGSSTMHNYTESIPPGGNIVTENICP